MMFVHNRIFGALFIVLCSQNGMAEIYKCKSPEGQVEFQDRRCDENSTLLEALPDSQATSCFMLTTSGGSKFRIGRFWTYEQDDVAVFYVDSGNRKEVFSPDRIQSIKMQESEAECASGTLVDTSRKSFDIAICSELTYLTDKGEKEQLSPYQLESIKSCKTDIKTDAGGIWELDGKKYRIRSAYAAYSKQSNQLKVIVFPFLLSKEEEAFAFKEKNMHALLGKKSSNPPAFGMIFQFRDGADEPQMEDVIQFQSLYLQDGFTRVRRYDRNWRSAIKIQRLQISKSKQGDIARISWSLDEPDQKANVNVSTQMVEENF